MRSFAAALGLACLVWASGLHAQTTDPHFNALTDAVAARLQAVKHVAYVKWRGGIAIENTGREQAVLDLARAEATAVGFPAETVDTFVITQMALARTLQASLMERWRQSPPDIYEPPSLDILRRHIGRATEQGIRALAQLHPRTDDRRLQKHFVKVVLEKTQGLPVDVKQLRAVASALGSLVRTGRPTGTLQRLALSDVLRVGTTGDYPPFSERVGGDYQGIDIQLARRLADSLGVQVRFVQTTWPTLMDDLAAGHFDIAMSGISRIPARARIGFFSVPYHTGGKAAITRCSEGTKYSSLPKIDRAATRVIVNRGGTNEKFVRQNIVQAQVTIIDDNTATFPAIAAGQADVMITDAIEVAWQSARDRRLCPALPPGKTFTISEKAFLMPQDVAWQHYVDVWLRQMMLEGAVERLIKAETAQNRDGPAR